MRAKAIRQAHAATDATEEKIAIAYKALTADRWCNGYGIYVDRDTVRSHLAAAKCAIEEALQALRDCDWPTDDEYEAAS